MRWWPWAARTASRPRPAAQFQVTIPPEMLQGMSGGGSIAPPIGRAEALQVPAVMRARNMIAGTLGSLPHTIHAPDRTEVNTTYLLGGNVDPDVPNSVVFAQTYEDLLFEGIAWWEVIEKGWHGFPVNARRVPVQNVHIGPSVGPSSKQISPDQPWMIDGKVYIDGVPKDDEQVIRFDSPNPPLLTHGARAIRTCLQLDKATAAYAKEPLPLGYFSPAEGAEELSDEEIQTELDRWESARQTRAWGYINAALQANVLQWDPEKLQLSDSRQHAVLEISRLSGVDPEYLGVQVTTRTYANTESRRQDLLDFTLAAYVSAMQDRLSMRDIVPRGYAARVKFDGFLRSDTKTRMETYKLGLEVGAYVEEEIRELEDKPALKPSQRPAPAPAPTPASDQPDMEGDPMVAFEPREDDSLRFSFASDEVAQSFRVDPDARTISGMVVPWGAVARSGFSKWRFAEGSLRWSQASRVKLNQHHDFRDLIGRATRLQSGRAGLMATFKIGEGAEEDRALSRAKDQILDGFSIEVDFVDEMGDTWQPDPSDESVRLVTQATLRGVALTGMPAFDDARVASVAAERVHNGGTHGQGAHDPQRPRRRIRIGFRAD